MVRLVLGLLLLAVAAAADDNNAALLRVRRNENAMDALGSLAS